MGCCRDNVGNKVVQGYLGGIQTCMIRMPQTMEIFMGKASLFLCVYAAQNNAQLEAAKIHNLYNVFESDE